jgi:hypothetical protein
MGHEIAHVALRHGTNQASKANLFQLGAMLGGSMVGGGIGGTLAQLGIGFGANSVLLKFSRGAESQADLLGAYMMARVGYNPVEAARFFEKLQAEGGKSSKLARLFSSHPDPGNRTERIEQQIQYMPQRSYDADTRQLERIKTILRGTKPPPDPKPQPGGQPGAQPGRQSGSGATPTAPTRASERYQNYRGRAFGLSFPENWQSHGNENQGSVTFAPQDGLVQLQGGGGGIARGVVASMTAAQRGQAVDLQRDTKQLIEQLKQSNPSMQVSSRPPRELQVDGRPALLTTIFSQSPFQGQTEIDLVLTVAHRNGLYYMVFIAPQGEFRQHQPTFESILRSVKFNN